MRTRTRVRKSRRRRLPKRGSRPTTTKSLLRRSVLLLRRRRLRRPKSRLLLPLRMSASKIAVPRRCLSRASSLCNPYSLSLLIAVVDRYQGTLFNPVDPSTSFIVQPAQMPTSSPCWPPSTIRLFSRAYLFHGTTVCVLFFRDIQFRPQCSIRLP
jgi:hypothetical protein